MELEGLIPSDGIRVFQQWISQRKDEVDEDNLIKLSSLVYSHSLSLRLLGGMFNNCDEAINQFIDNIRDRLQTALEKGSANERHESVNACIKYSFANLDKFLLHHLKAFETLFAKTLVTRSLGCDMTLALSTGDDLHKLWQHSWLNRHIYKVDSMLGDWRPSFIEKDTKFYSLHPRLRDLINNLTILILQIQLYLLIQTFNSTLHYATELDLAL